MEEGLPPHISRLSRRTEGRKRTGYLSRPRPGAVNSLDEDCKARKEELRKIYVCIADVFERAVQT